MQDWTTDQVCAWAYNLGVQIQDTEKLKNANFNGASLAVANAETLTALGVHPSACEIILYNRNALVTGTLNSCT